MSFEINGLDKLQKNLEKMEQRAREAEETHQVSFAELFTPGFMKARTQFGSIQELFDAFGTSSIQSQEDFDRLIQSEEWNTFIARSTQFGSWNEIYAAAAQEQFARGTRVQVILGLSSPGNETGRICHPGDAAPPARFARLRLYVARSGVAPGRPALAHALPSQPLCGLAAAFPPTQNHQKMRGRWAGKAPKTSTNPSPTEIKQHPLLMVGLLSKQM